VSGNACVFCFSWIIGNFAGPGRFHPSQKQDGAWWVYYHLTRGHGGVLIVKYKYTVIKTGKSITATKELPDGQGVMVGKVNEVTEPVVTGSEFKVLITDPAHAK
jgi:hypothetical protein